MADLKNYTVTGERKIQLESFSTVPENVQDSKEDYLERTRKNQERIAQLQDRMYAEGKESVVVILQAMDAGGKDSTIKHLMSGLNPQGIDVYSYKAPSAEELAHDYLWRASKNFPAKGKIAIFNRSYYEDVLIVKVHELYKTYNMAQRCLQGDVIGRRYREIRNFEEYQYNNSCRIVKIFLHLSKEEQKERFLERIELKMKNWKFSSSDVKERKYWDAYQSAYEDAVNATATKETPWYVLPADKKWYTRYLVSEILLNTLIQMDPHYPQLPKKEQDELMVQKEILLSE